MKKYATVFRKTLALQFTYNSNVLFSIISSVMFLILQYALWEQIVSHSEQSLTLEMMMTYIILGLLIRNFTTVDISEFLSEQVNKGSIDLYLVKPYSLFVFSFFRHLSIITGTFIMRSLIILLACMPFIGSHFEINFSYSLYFVIGLCNAIVMSFCIDYIIGLLAFVFVQIWPIKFLVRDVGNIFSGYYVPLWFFPEWLVVIASLLPFKYMHFFPINIIIGTYSEREIWQQLLIGMSWTASFLLIIAVVWHFCKKNLVTQGG